MKHLKRAQSSWNFVNFVSNISSFKETEQQQIETIMLIGKQFNLLQLSMGNLNNKSK